MSISDNTIIINNYIVNQLTGEIIGIFPPAGDEDGKNPAVGLSTFHNTRKINKVGVIRVYPEGSIIEVSKNRDSVSTDLEIPCRGKITGFSKKSRLRLLKTLGKVSKKELPYFITLTYPEKFPDEKEVYKSDLEKFIKRLVYRFPKVSGFWRLEFQKRGAPHYHLLVWGLPNADLTRYISNIWYQVVKSGDIKHLHAGTQIKKVRSWRGVMSYASKYMAKEGDYGQEVGRIWGVFNKNCVPWSPVLEIEISQQKVVQLMRLMRRYARIKSRDYASLTIFIKNPDDWLRLIE